MKTYYKARPYNTRGGNLCIIHSQGSSQNCPNNRKLAFFLCPPPNAGEYNWYWLALFYAYVRVGISSYYHETGHINHQPLFRIQSWKNCRHCMLCSIRIVEIHNIYKSPVFSEINRPQFIKCGFVLPVHVSSNPTFYVNNLTRCCVEIKHTAMCLNVWQNIW